MQSAAVDGMSSDRIRPPSPVSNTPSPSTAEGMDNALRFTSMAALLTECETRLRLLHRSDRTMEAYLTWIRRFVAESGRKSPELMGSLEVTRFLSQLAVQRRVSASTQNQALAALLFLFRDLVGRPREHMHDVVAARQV